MAAGETRLSTGTLIAYSLPGAPTTFLYTLVLVMFMNFATDVLRVPSPATIGLIFLVSKLWDAVSDPAAGYLSDRTRSRFGRRKSWLLVSSVPLGLFAYMIWAPPASFEGAALNAWIAVSIFGLYTAYTVFEVPHMALAAELTQEPQQRNRVFGARQLLKTVGLFAAFGIGANILEDPETARENALWMGGIMGALTIVLIWACVARLPPERSDYLGRGARNPLGAVRDVWGNRHARLVLFVFFIESLGMGGIGVLVPFVIRYVMKTPHLIAELLLIYNTSMLLGIPLWVWLGRRFEKRKLWLYAMCQAGVGFGLISFVDEGTVGLLVVSSILAGSGGACAATLGQSIKADIIDFDEYQTGERKEGSYFAAWQFVSKLAQGIMLGVVGIALEWVGFEAGVEQTQATKNWMLFLMGGLPIIGYALGIAAFSRFRLTQAEHTRILKELEARRA